MTRDPLFDKDWFNTWIQYEIGAIERFEAERQTPAGDPSYRPQFVYELFKKYYHLLLRRYGRGDPVDTLAEYFDPLLGAWEEAERLGQDVWTAQQQHTRHAWSTNLDHYVRCFWLVGLALALDIDDVQWKRLLDLIGNEGEDELLDRVIASRQTDRRIGTALCHPKPYQRLLDTVNAPAGDQCELLKAFVEHWYHELDRPPRKGLARETAMYERPYWYEYHLAEGGYFGYWCVEAVAVAKAFGIDDSLCLGLQHYPGDLLRPNGPTTHKQATISLQRRAADAVTIKQTLVDRVRKALFAPKI